VTAAGGVAVGEGAAVGAGEGTAVDVGAGAGAAVGAALPAEGDGVGAGAVATAGAGRPTTETVATTRAARDLTSDVRRFARGAFGFMCLSGATTRSGKHVI
jgi:hypothetical protein